MSNVNMSVPKTNFLVNVSTCVFVECFRHFRERKSNCWKSPHS